MLRQKFNAILILCCLTVFGTGCSNSLDTGGDDSLSTTISYQLNEETHVKMWVQNAYKTTVATLVDEVQPPGVHTSTFVAVDSNGNNLPEGIYTYRLETDSLSESRVFHLFY